MKIWELIKYRITREDSTTWNSPYVKEDFTLPLSCVKSREGEEKVWGKGDEAGGGRGGGVGKKKGGEG